MEFKCKDSYSLIYEFLNGKTTLEIKKENIEYNLKSESQGEREREREREEKYKKDTRERNNMKAKERMRVSERDITRV